MKPQKRIVNEIRKLNKVTEAYHRSSTVPELNSQLRMDRMRGIISVFPGAFKMLEEFAEEVYYQATHAPPTFDDLVRFNYGFQKTLEGLNPATSS